MTVPYLEYVDSSWKTLEGNTVDSVEVGETGYVQVDMHNPTRIHSLQERFVCEFYGVGDQEPVFRVSKDVSVPPLTDGQYIFRFQFDTPGEYSYRILSGERVLTDLTTMGTLIVE